MKTLSPNNEGPKTLVRQQLKALKEPSDLDKNRQAASQVGYLFIPYLPFSLIGMVLERTWNSTLRYEG